MGIKNLRGLYMISEWVLFNNEFIPVATWYQSKIVRNESFLNEFIEILIPEWNTYSGRPFVPVKSTRGTILISVWILGNGWGCLSYLSGVKISDPVPFTVSQTFVDYQRPNWYLLGCFSLNKIPVLSITRTILMIWLELLEHIDKGVLIFGIFQFFWV